MAVDDIKGNPFQRIANIGVREEFLVTEKRYLQVSNIAAMLGVLFNVIWLSIAISILEITSAVWNVVLGLMFLMVVVLNQKGRRVAASVWLAISAYISVLVFLYLSGYRSGITTVCILIIIVLL